MKILHIISHFGSKWSGPQTALFNIAKAFQERGHKIAIFSSNYFFNPSKIEELRGVEIRTFPVELKFNKFLFSPQMEKALDYSIKDFDLIHLHEHWTYQNIVAGKISKKHHVPFVHQARGSLPIREKTYLLKIFFNILFGNELLKKASKVIALSESEKQQYLDKGVSVEKIEVIPNCIDLKKFKKAGKKGFLHKRFGIKKFEKIILFFGRITERKGVGLLLESFFEICKQQDDCVLVIAGYDDGFLKTIEKRIALNDGSNKVFFAGNLNDYEKIAALHDSTVFVLPSKSEGLPNVVLEAAACGLPVVVTKNCNLQEVTQYFAGTEINYDKNELAKALQKILSDKKLRQKMSKNAEKMVKEKFDIEKIVYKIENLYLKILKEKN